MSDNSAGEDDRFSYVASFYGPGNTVGWLAALASVFITWTVNLEYRRKDSISTDLVFAVAVPCVAAGHVIHDMLLTPADGDERPVTIEQLFTSADPILVRRAASAEAGLNICETFASAAVVLVFISMLNGHLKRTIVVMIGGFLAFSTEVMVFFRTRGLAVDVSNLSRPFLFNFFGVMVAILAFLGVWIAVFTFVILWMQHRAVHKPDEQVQLEPADIQLEADLRAVLAIGAPASAVDISTSSIRSTARKAGEEYLTMQRITIMTFWFLPLSLLMSSGGAAGAWGSTVFMKSLGWTSRLPFFVPRSNTVITELDQMFTACFGVVGILFSLWHAFRSRKREAERARQEIMQKRVEERREHLAQAVRRLQELNLHIDQARNEDERKEWANKRNTLISIMFDMTASPRPGVA